VDVGVSPHDDGGWSSVAPRVTAAIDGRTALEVVFAPELERSGFSTVDYTLLSVRRAFVQSAATVVTGSAGVSISRRRTNFVGYGLSPFETVVGPVIGFAVEHRVAPLLALRAGADFVMGALALLRIGGGVTVPIGGHYAPAAPSLADTSGGRLPAVRVGQTIWIIDAEGVTHQGELASSRADSLTLTTRAGATTIAASDIRRIERPDSLRNGLAIGTASGAIPGAVFGAIIGNLLCEESGGCAVVGALAFGGIGAGIGALTGLLIDSFRDGRQVVYDERPSRTALTIMPIAGGRGTPRPYGMAARIAW
jgi:hypothetical protein